MLFMSIRFLLRTNSRITAPQPMHVSAHFIADTVKYHRILYHKMPSYTIVSFLVMLFHHHIRLRFVDYIYKLADRGKRTHPFLLF